MQWSSVVSPRAGGPHDGGELALFHPQGDPVQGLHLTGAKAEGFGEIGNGDNVHARLPHFPQEIDGEGGPLPHFGFHTDVTPLAGDDALGQVEAQAHPLLVRHRLGPVEPLEDLVILPSGMPMPVSVMSIRV